MKKRLLSKVGLACIVTSMLFSCKEKEEVDVMSGDYFVSLRTQGKEGTSDYALLQGNLLNGEISAEGRGIEQLGWCYYATVGNTAFSFSYGNASNKCIGYHKVNGELKEKGSMMFNRMDCMGKGDDNTLIAIGAPWGGGTLNTEIQLIDVNTVGLMTKKTSPIYLSSPSDTLNKWPTGILVRDGKMYVSFYPVGGKSWLTPSTDTAYVSVFTYPGLDYIQTIKDTRTGPIGFYAGPESMIMTEDGDIYTFSPNSFGAGYTQVTKSSGILRIKKGASSFDKDYFFDVQAASGGHYKILSGTYVGNGKIVARVIVDEQQSEDWQWAALQSDNPVCKIIIIDLESQSISEISGVPMHGGQYASRALVENGKMYTSINAGGSNGCAIYEIDPTTATGTKGAVVKGIEIPAIFKLKDE
ncbi:DUF4374 domain-containing protein [Sporocytophaga myxococcoides]|uniref:DUF4374 domain-containing protein n=1 Tax=Sporocytophaga myxococcoides TaxID=153721 RepID=UPI0004219413|nr:DUF4374 domain-containing protein [Sporocytophaga myxococcoides]